MGGPAAAAALAQQLAGLGVKGAPPAAHSRSPSHSHTHGHVNARASASVEVLSFTRALSADEDGPLRLGVAAASGGAANWTDVGAGWSSHPGLNALVALECGILVLPYCTDDSDDQTAPQEWHALKLDQACVLPLVRFDDQAPVSAASHTYGDGSGVVEVRTVVAAGVALFLPPHPAAHPSPSHPSHGQATPHTGLPPASHRSWRACHLVLANPDRVLEVQAQAQRAARTPEAEAAAAAELAWLDADTGAPSEDVVEWSDFAAAPPSSSASASTRGTDGASPSASSSPSVWSSESMPGFLREVYHHFQLSLTGRQHEHTAPSPSSLAAAADGGAARSSHNGTATDDDEFGGSGVFLETASVIDVSSGAAVRAELAARELADTNDMYRLMGQLADATRTGASATVVWELVIRPLVNILRKVLLHALRELMAKTLIKALFKLVTSTINPVAPPPDESEYTVPPVAEVEDPEELWSSEPAQVPEAVVPAPDSGTDFGASFVSLRAVARARGLVVHGDQVSDRAFLGVTHVHGHGLGALGIVDPMLAYLVPVLHNTVTQAVTDIARKGMTKSVQLHSIAPMKEQIHAAVHKLATKMLTEQLTEQLTEHVTTHLIAQLPVGTTQITAAAAVAVAASRKANSSK